MFKYNLKIAFRNIIRQKIFSLINIIGLAVGMACSFLILLYVLHEFSYDKMHEKRDRIYRVIYHYTPSPWSRVPDAIAHTIRNNNFPEILKSTRWLSGGTISFYIKKENKYIKENSRISFADNEVFEIFNLPTIKGYTEKMLESTTSIVITERIANKYFENQNPVGQDIIILRRTDEVTYTVTGVIKDYPENSTIKADFIGNNSSMKADESMMKFFGAARFQCYILLPDGYNPLEFETKLNDFAKTNYPDITMAFTLQNLSNIYLHSASIFGDREKGDLDKIYLFSAISFLILLID